MRAIKHAQRVIAEGFGVVEDHTASTRKALRIPTKEWSKIQEMFVSMGFAGDAKARILTPPEIDVATAALTGYLHLKQKTELIGDRIEGYIVVPTKSDWRLLKT